jgi:hypothetical protein
VFFLGYKHDGEKKRGKKKGRESGKKETYKSGRIRMVE